MAFDLDNTTLLLLAILAVFGLYHRFFSAPTPLVHPLLLGRQSDVSSVRKKGESGIYRSFATGQGSPFTVRPASTLKTVKDIAQRPKDIDSQKQRQFFDVALTDEALAEILRLLPLGLRSLFPQLSESTSILTILPPSTLTAFPLLLLQLGAASPLIISPTPANLTEALTNDKHPKPAVVVVHANLMDDVVEQVWEDTHGATGVLVVGDPNKTKDGLIKAAAARGMSVHYWEEIWEVAETAKPVEIPEPIYSDIHSYFYSTSADGDNVVSKVTHTNITAGIAGLLSTFPADKRPSTKDVVASSVPLNTPFGMTIALASIWSGAGYRFVGPAQPTWPESLDVAEAEEELMALSANEQQALPSILFCSDTHHKALVRSLHHFFLAHPLASFAARHKLAGIKGGDVSRDGRFESFVWAPMRQKPLRGLLGDSLRSVIVVGDAPAEKCLALSHLLLSFPISRVRSSHYSAGPICASHYYDLQCRIPSDLSKLSTDTTGPQAHVGPPASNVEVVLRGENIETELEDQEPLTGEVFIRGPAVLEKVGISEKEWWVSTGERAAVQTNGTFRYGV